MVKQENIEHEKNINEQLSGEMMEIICRKAVAVLETKKLYLKHDISIWELSRETGISAKKVSHSINRHLGTNFRKMVNRLRLEEAKRLIRETVEKQTSVKLSYISMQCGFRSRTAFYEHFSKFEGMTPKEYMNRIQNVNINK